MNDAIELCREQIRAAVAARAPLRPRGGGSKDFLGRTPVGAALDTRGLSGVLAYEPAELVVTAGAGTPLAEVQALLAQHGQRLPFEPPHFAPGGTLGGAVATGLSGPGRLAAGALRDFMLGVKIIDGRADLLAFGGQVMKNVAGYDVSRLMAGSFGTLGLIVEVSLKVLPRPLAELSLRFELTADEALTRLNQWGGTPLPISASSWCDGVLSLRLSGAKAAVAAAASRLGGERLDADTADAWWAALRDHRAAFFGEGEAPLWRMSLPTTTPPMAGDWLIEWGGGQRWQRSDAPPAQMQHLAAAAGGHATLFRGGNRDDSVFQPLAAPLMAIQQRLKQAFDPAGIFSPGRIYDGF